MRRRPVRFPNGCKTVKLVVVSRERLQNFLSPHSHAGPKPHTSQCWFSLAVASRQPLLHTAITDRTTRSTQRRRPLRLPTSTPALLAIIGYRHTSLSAVTRSLSRRTANSSSSPWPMARSSPLLPPRSMTASAGDSRRIASPR